MRITKVLAGVLLGFALAISACGGDDGGTDDDKNASASGDNGSGGSDGDGGDGGDDGPLDACTLLTPADLETAFGSPFDDGEPTHQEQTGGDQCVWTNTDAPPVKTFSVTVLRGDHLEGAIKSSGISVPELFEQTKEAYGDVEDIDLGDEAFISGSEITVLDGETQFSFSTFLGTSDVAIDGLKVLAAKVVG